MRKGARERLLRRRTVAVLDAGTSVIGGEAASSMLGRLKTTRSKPGTAIHVDWHSGSLRKLPGIHIYVGSTYL
jgi:hypothetical protein